MMGNIWTVTTCEFYLDPNSNYKNKKCDYNEIIRNMITD